MAKTAKATKVRKFEEIEKILVDNGISTMEIDGEMVDLPAFIRKERDMVEHKNATKVAKTSSADVSAIADIENALLTYGALTPTEIMAKVGLPNTQKVASLVSKMPNVTRTQVGKKVTYSI